MNIVYNLFLEKKSINIIIIDQQMPYIKGSHMIYLFKKIAHENNFYLIKFISYSAFKTKDIREHILKKRADLIINRPASYDKFSEVINLLESIFSNKFYKG